MKEKKTFESQFSIYKVDFEQSFDLFLKELNIIVDNYVDLQQKIIEIIKDEINKKNTLIIEDLKYGKYIGILFKTKHNPIWWGTITSIINQANNSEEKNKVDISNIRVSYILTYITDNNIFILTGGLGSSYIGDFTQKNYGLYLLPKILSPNSPVIKTVLENHLSGNRMANMHANRKSTTIVFEKDMSKIFRELSLEINNDIIKTLNISVKNPEKNNIINIDARDSFVIRKSLSLEELSKVLDRLVEIEQQDDRFTLGYFIDAKKEGYHTKDLNEILILDLMTENRENFSLIGDDYYSYCIGVDNYIVLNQDDEIIYNQEEPITMSDLYKNVIKRNSKSEIESFLKYKVATKKEGEYVMFPTKIKECIQGKIENEEGKPFYIFNGSWLVMDKNYISNLNEEFQNAFNFITDIGNKVELKIKSQANKKTEDEYNLSFCESEELIVAHKVMSNNIELADLIYYDDNHLYLIHNKNKFSGSGARDVLTQILTSSEFIRHNVYDRDKDIIFGNYYDKIKEQYPNNKKICKISKDEFIKLFEKEEIIYIAGFMNGLKEGTNSNYAKYMIVDAYKTLLENGFSLKITGINQ